MSFLGQFFRIDEGRKEAAVCCPFPHVVPGSGMEYYEHDPSAHVNAGEGVFHCKACGRGFNEITFIIAVLGCSYGDALRLASVFRRAETDVVQWDKETSLSEDSSALLDSFGITPAVQQELKVCTTDRGVLGFPVFMYDLLVDVRQYNPGGDPKVRSMAGAIAGLLLPFEQFINEDPDRPVLLCAGEKDMAVARSHGFNAYTLTGGENTKPIFPLIFKGRKVVVVYDNDAPGKNGAIRLCAYLQSVATSVKNCTNFHEVCTENGEDLTDFFVKYEKTRADLIQFLEATPEFVVPSGYEDVFHPMLTLHQAATPKHLGKVVRSNIQITATSDMTFQCPTVIIGEKFRMSGGDRDTMPTGAIRDWAFSEDTAQDILHLIDNNMNESKIEENCRDLMHIMQKEPYIRIRKPVKETVFKCQVTDMFETSTGDVMHMEFIAYSVGIKLESGKKYLVSYKLVPHPYKGQQLIMIVLSATQAIDTVSNFKVTDDVKLLLAKFQREGTVEERITELVEQFKGVLGYDGNNMLITTIDLAYHTVLLFNFGQFKNVRGYLDTLIVGESRMGKSSTAEAMRTLYGLGTFTSLAGNAATIPGLIGGSNKVDGAYQTRAGLIPQNHKGMVIFEELGKTNSNIIGELTDIRSSNEVRIARVSGTLTLPAFVRMVTLTNVKTSDGVIKPIASYPHGVAILTELIGTAEDIARYDLACVLGDRGAQQVDPFWTAPERLEDLAYRTRIRWVWSRTPEQISIAPDVGRYLVQLANELNQRYECHIKIFGTEAWKKIARLAIAVAGYLVSTDATYENIIVQQEHVDFAVRFLITMYDNPIFKFKEYCDFEKKYSMIDDAGIALLQDVWIKSPALLLHLEQVAESNKNTLTAVTGMKDEDYNLVMNKLISGMFVKFSKFSIIPTERFRKGMARINRITRVPRVGEVAQ